jgi:hypothetical protein
MILIKVKRPSKIQEEWVIDEDGGLSYEKTQALDFKSIYKATVLAIKKGYEAIEKGKRVSQWEVLDERPN